jgi:solute carrier family 35 protein C2
VNSREFTLLSSRKGRLKVYNSIIQRAGVVPMSIAGIAKEVTTISISAAIFGDSLTPLNITGVAITVCGL